MNEKKVLLSVKDLVVKFRVRDRVLTAIRGISLDIYENESIGIVGESGSGKSVFTKTFAGMLDDNGYIDTGSIIFNDDELAETKVSYGKKERIIINQISKKLNKYSKLMLGSSEYKEILNVKKENKERYGLTEEESNQFNQELNLLNFKKVEAQNLKQTIDSKLNKEEFEDIKNQISLYENKIVELENKKKQLINKHRIEANKDIEYKNNYKKRILELNNSYRKKCLGEISDEVRKTNTEIAKEIYLSVGRYDFSKRYKLILKLMKAFKMSYKLGVDLQNDEIRNNVFDNVVFRVKYVSETENQLIGTCIINLSKIKYGKDWSQIRGCRIATVFQDPMTSLNPIVTIGNQIVSIILKHQNCSQIEARARALELMHKVGIPNPEKRFDDYPFQYSGGMRQRIVIAIALSCQPKILICDEPTTALDVTIQAQILKLLKELQKEFHYSIVFITHDLGVVANVADRVAVLYAGQVVEIGNVDEVFYDPRHPYTWALLSALPQLAQRNTNLYCIKGTPPSLYNKIIGDPFAPRNPYCLKIDTLKEPPLFKITDTHYAKTWLLDPRSPKIEKPEAIQNIHEKLIKAYHIGE